MIGGVSTSLPAPDPVEGAPAPGAEADAAAAAALFGDLVAQLLAPQAAPAGDAGAAGATAGRSPVGIAPLPATGDRPATLVNPAPPVDAEAQATVAPSTTSAAPARTATALGPAATALATAAAAPVDRHRPERPGRPAPAATPGAELLPAAPTEAAVDPAPIEAPAPVEPAPDAGADPLPGPTAPGLDAPPTTTADPLPAQPADSAPTPPPAADPVAPLHEQVAVKVRSLQLHEGDRHSITVDLHPAELGAVTLEVRVRDGKVDVTLRAERPGAAEALGSSLHDLADSLGGHGFDVGDLDVGPRLPLDLDRWSPPPSPGQHDLARDARRGPHHERHPDRHLPDPDDHLVFDALL